MSFSIQTNANSLIAQENLRVNSNFQSQTIRRLTSGYRINQSGDDAAGLAVANKFRSDTAELAQGVRNANDGVSQLQIADGGMSNISKMLDRLKTLAAQSGSATFTGDRTVLNSEFSTLVGEIDRQASAIGLNTGGDFAKSLSVYLGGGKGATDATLIANGTVVMDLSRATVDSQSLNLKGVQAVNSSVTTGFNLASSAGTSVQNIISKAANLASLQTPNTTVFKFIGPGFSDVTGISVGVNISGVADSTSLVAAINAAIQSAGNQTTGAAAAFKAANITASISTDSNGVQKLAFNSANSAFQVEAGDLMSNALLGNTVSSTDATGNAMSYTVTATGSGVAVTGAPSINVRIVGASLSSPVDLTVTGANNDTQASLFVKLRTAIAANSTLVAAGFSSDGASVVSNSKGESFRVEVTGDVNGTMGFGAFLTGAANGDYSTYTAAAAPGTDTTAGNLDFNFSFAGAASIRARVVVLATDTATTAANNLNAAIAADATLSKTDLIATVVGGKIVLSSASGTMFRLAVTSSGGSWGFDTAAVTTAQGGYGTAAATAGLSFSSYVASGTYEIATSAGVATNLAWANLRYADDSQSITINANDASGGTHMKTVTLTNNSTTQNGNTIDGAIKAINTALQTSNDSTLQKIVAVKVLSGGAETINFISMLPKFSVALSTDSGLPAPIGMGTAGQQGTSLAAYQVGAGSALDISTQAGASTAVTAITSAVRALGVAQAAVGKSQNQLGYAIGLAQSQISSFSSAESQLRDADIAAEAANLTKASVLQQATMAAMAQANTAPQAVLALLRG